MKLRVNVSTLKCLRLQASKLSKEKLNTKRLTPPVKTTAMKKWHAVSTVPITGITQALVDARHRSA